MSILTNANLHSAPGGLAAPAIAAGLGSAVGLAGGVAGIAGAGAAGASFAGMMGSTVGVLTITGGIGVAGGNYVGAKTARRIGEVMVSHEQKYSSSRYLLAHPVTDRICCLRA